MNTLFVFALISLLIAGMQLTWHKVDTEVDMSKKTEEERKKVVEKISKHIHPHDDEPDPTAHMGNYNFPQMLFAFCIGFCTMFVLAVDEINDFKGCPLPEYFKEPK